MFRVPGFSDGRKNVDQLLRFFSSVPYTKQGVSVNPGTGRNSPEHSRDTGGILRNTLGTPPKTSGTNLEHLPGRLEPSRNTLKYKDKTEKS